MADLAEALDAALTNRYPWGEPKRPITHGQGRNARMNRLQKAVGGDRSKAAAAAGIPYSTWGHMLAGRGVSPRNLRKLEAAFTRLVMRPAMAAVIARKGYPEEWHVSAVVVTDPKGSRYINGKKDGPGGVDSAGAEQGWRKFRAQGVDGEPTVEAWLTHGASVITAAAFEKEVATAYGGTEFAFEGHNVEVTLHGRR